jgi:dsRNA-specific ribonuclease
MHMPEMQAYVPDELQQQSKETGADPNHSGILQEALTHRTARIERQRLLGEALNIFEKEHGTISAAEIAAQETLDKKSAIRPRARRG